MKIFYVLFFLSLTTLGFSQKHEISFDATFGGATKIFNTQKQIESFKWRDYEDPDNVNRKALSFHYKHHTFQKFGLSFFTGIDFVQNKYQFKLIGPNAYLVAKPILTKNYLNLKIIGLSEQLTFYNGNLSLNFGFAFIHRIFFNNVNHYTSDLTYSPTADWIIYDYDITTYYSDKNYFVNADNITWGDYYFNWEYHILGQAKLSDKFFLNFGFTYTRNFIMFNQNLYNVYYYHDGVETYHLQNLGSIDNSRSGIKHQFLNFKFGISYKFDKFNWQKKD